LLLTINHIYFLIKYLKRKKIIDSQLLIFPFDISIILKSLVILLDLSNHRV